MRQVKRIKLKLGKKRQDKKMKRLIHKCLVFNWSWPIVEIEE